MAEPERRDSKHAIIYFDRKNTEAFKELGARVREAKGRTTLVWSSRWQGPQNILKEGRAVIIQKGCANADDICDAYRQYASDVEIHFVDDAGEFLEGETAVDPTQEEKPEAGDDSAANDKSGEDAEASTETDAAVQDDSANEEGADEGSSDDGGDDTSESVPDDSVKAESVESTDPERASSR